MRALTWMLMAALVGACSFDPSGLASDDGGPRPDAPLGPADAATSDGETCAPGCVDDRLQVCEPTPSLEPCTLGCTPGALACRTLVPSNGASVTTHLVGVADGLDVPAGQDGLVDTDTGAIDIGGVERRSGGEGVDRGIGFYVLSDRVAVLGVSSMAIGFGATLRLRGGRALIVLSQGDAIIEGVLEVSAGCASGGVTCAGPGGGNGTSDDRVGASGCAPGGNGDGATGLKPETGGGGGGFASAGAAGGTADGNNPGGNAGVPPGTCAGPELEPLMGGSGGGAGGVDDCGGDGGGGGGAVQITSLTRIAVLGNALSGLTVGVRASGAGGRGGENSDGGGGGGAGGGILLESLRIELDHAVLAANGGGGGGGGSSPDGNRGADGPFGNAQAAGGGGGLGGGAGASALGAATAGAGGGDDTGGGGGGVGVLRLNVPVVGLITGPEVIVSPMATRGDPGSE
jgi:hypothetical protein